MIIAFNSSKYCLNSKQIDILTCMLWRYYTSTQVVYYIRQMQFASIEMGRNSGKLVNSNLTLQSII